MQLLPTLVHATRPCSVFEVWKFRSMYSHDYAICNDDVAKKKKRKENPCLTFSS